MLMFFVGAVAAALIYTISKCITDKKGFEVGVMLFSMVIGGAVGFILKMIVDIFMTFLH
jgi:hypothetical protein